MPLSKFRVVAGICASTLVLAAAKPKPFSGDTSHPLHDSVATDASTAAASGVTFNYKITSSSDNKRVREAKSSLMTVRMQDGNVRMDYVEGLTPMGEKGGYMLLLAKDARYAVVSPKEKKVIMMGTNVASGGMGGMMNNPMVKITFSNSSFRYKDMGAGEAILGFNTRHIRTWQTNTMSMKLPMMPDQKITTSDSADLWIGQDVGISQPDLEKWFKSFAANVKANTPEVQAELDKFGKAFGNGLALRTVTWSTETDKNGKSTSDVITAEVTDIKQGAIEASVFEIPKGYEVVDLDKMMGDMSASMDSASADGKNGAKKGDEKVKPADAIKEGLGGLFRKKKN